jgi:hypothetical protein
MTADDSRMTRGLLGITGDYSRITRDYWDYWCVFFALAALLLLFCMRCYKSTCIVSFFQHFFHALAPHCRPGGFGSGGGRCWRCCCCFGGAPLSWACGHRLLVHPRNEKCSKTMPQLLGLCALNVISALQVGRRRALRVRCSVGQRTTVAHPYASSSPSFFSFFCFFVMLCFILSTIIVVIIIVVIFFFLFFFFIIFFMMCDVLLC